MAKRKLKILQGSGSLSKDGVIAIALVEYKIKIDQEIIIGEITLSHEIRRKSDFLNDLSGNVLTLHLEDGSQWSVTVMKRVGIAPATGKYIIQSSA